MAVQQADRIAAASENDVEGKHPVTQTVEVSGAVREQLQRALLQALDARPTPVGDLLAKVAAREDADVELVASAMWDLVEQERIGYGSDAMVRPSR